LTGIQQLQAGLEHHKAGRLQKAQRLYRRFLSAYPEHPEALHLLGLALRQSGDNDGAEPLFKRAIARNPNNALYHNNLGNTLRDKGRPEEAAHCYRRALALDPRLAAAHSNLGRVLREQGELAEAVAACRRAVELEPNLVEGWHNLGLALDEAGQARDAVTAYRRALALSPEMVAARCGLGRVLQRMGEYQEAMACYQEVLHSRPGGSRDERRDALCGMGLVRYTQGDASGALECYDRALRLDPHHANTYLNRALAKKHRLGEGDAEAIEALLRRESVSDEDAAKQYFALGKIYDDCGRYDEAFANFKKAHKLKPKKTEYSADNLSAFVDRVIEVFSPDLLAEKAALGCRSDLPVFIVGMPRSGTTLVEQILCSHPDVFGAGELLSFAEVRNTLSQRLGGSSPYPECVRRLDAETTRALAQEYLGTLRGYSDAARRITDKMPYNFWHLGLVRILFPNARVVHCRRDPVDTCVSIYTTHFSQDMPYTHELRDLGRHYRDYRRLMAHWRGILGGQMLELGYEDLVADQEGQSQRLIEFLGLQWDARCLEFHRNPRPVLTASNLQVRQPMYGGSVGRWRRYERHLAPLLEALDGGA
jgi:tetratricopeptide (TPR) repeat protein